MRWIQEGATRKKALKPGPVLHRQRRDQSGTGIKVALENLKK